MRTFKAKQGPFQERPYYTSNEIDRICLDELTAAGLLPSGPSTVVSSDLLRNDLL
jgi:hypothetical protein